MSDDVLTSKLNSRKQTRIPEQILEDLEISKDGLIGYKKVDGEWKIKKPEVRV